MPDLSQEDSGFTLPILEDDSEEIPLTVEPLPYVPSEEMAERMRVQAVVDSVAAWEELSGCDDLS